MKRFEIVGFPDGLANQDIAPTHKTRISNYSTQEENMEKHTQNLSALKLAILATTTTLVSIGSSLFADKICATTLAFDSLAGSPRLSYSASIPRTYIGQAFSADPAFPYSNLIVNRMTVNMLSVAAVNYNNIKFNVSFWDNFDPSATSVFSNLITSFDVSLGALNTAGNTYYIKPFSFGDVTFTGLNNHGVSISFKGDTGSGLVNTDNLTSLLRYSSSVPIAVGSNAASNGYYVNTSGRTDSNFTSGDLDASAPNVALGMALYYDAPIVPTPTAVPEPFTVIGTIVGGTAALRMRKKLKSAK